MWWSLFAAIAVAGVPAPPPFSSSPADFERRVSDACFPSGLRVTVVQDARQPVVALTTVIDRGADADPRGREGAAHLLEHLWFRARPGGRPVAHTLDDLGGLHNAYTLGDATVYATVAGAGATRDLLALEAARLTDPLVGVDDAIIEQERAIVASEGDLRGFGTDDLVRLLPSDLHADGVALAPHSEASLRAITRQDLREVASAHAPHRVTLHVVGDVAARDVVAWVQELFPESLLFEAAPGAPADVARCPARRSAVAATPPPVRAPAPPAPVVAHVEEPVWMIGFALPAGYGADEPMMRLATDVLDVRIARRLAGPRFDGVAHTCRLLPGARRSTAVCLATVPEGVAGERVREKVLDALAELGDLDDEALTVSLAAQRLRTGIALSLDALSPLTSDGPLRDALSVHFTGEPEWYVRALSAADAIDAASLERFSREWLDPDRAREVLVVSPGVDAAAVMRGDAESSAGAGGAVEAPAVDEASRPVASRHHVEARREGGASAAAVGAARVAAPVKAHLANGLQVLAIPHGEVPMVRVALVARGGPLAEAEPGLDEWAWDQLGIDISQLPVGSLRIAQDALSARMWTASLPDARVIGTTGSAATLDGQLWLLRNFAESAGRIEDDTWLQESRLAARRAARAARADPAERASQAVRAHLLGPAHPLVPSWQEARHLGASVAPARVGRYIQAQFRPDAATLIVVGAADPAAVQRAAARWFESWPVPRGAPLVPRPQAAPPPTSPVAHVAVEAGSEQARVGLACRVGEEDAPTEVGVEWIRERVFADLRESEVSAYDPEVGTWNTGDARVLVLSATVAPERVAAAVGAIDATLAALGQGPSAEDVARIGHRLRARWPQRYLDTADVLWAAIEDRDTVAARAAGRQGAIGGVRAEHVRAWAAACAPGAALWVVGPAEAPLAGTAWAERVRPAPTLDELRAAAAPSR